MKSIITLVVAFLTVGLMHVTRVRAQNEPKSQEAKKPPTPKERAREIADKAIDTITGSQPDTQVAGLLHLAEIYTDLTRRVRSNCSVRHSLPPHRYLRRSIRTSADT